MRNIILWSIAILLSVLISVCYAESIIPSDSKSYYQLGGGADISIPPVTNQSSLTLNPQTNIGQGFSCDGFNPAVSVSNTINHIDQSVENLSNDVLGAATAAVSSMPMYVLEKASPELYNLIQNTINGALNTFDLSTKSCQAALDTIQQGKSMYQDWLSLFNAQGWLNYAKSAEQGVAVDINTAKTEITKNLFQWGVPWVHQGQNSGGTTGNQQPIKVIYDAAVAGYNVMTDSKRALDNLLPASVNSVLSRYWSSPDQIGQWAQRVIGDISVTADAVKRINQAGTGLATLLTDCPNVATNSLTCVAALQKQLSNIINSNHMPTAEQLTAVSSPQLVISPEVIQAIKDLSPEQQAIAISKLSQDVAIQNVVNQALLLRQLLISSAKTAPIYNLKPALNTVNNTVTELEKSISQLMYDYQIRQQMLTHSVDNILAMAKSTQTLVSQTVEKTQAPQARDAAVYSSGP